MEIYSIKYATLPVFIYSFAKKLISETSALVPLFATWFYITRKCRDIDHYLKRIAYC